MATPGIMLKVPDPGPGPSLQLTLGDGLFRGPGPTAGKAPELSSGAPGTLLRLPQPGRLQNSAQGLPGPCSASHSQEAEGKGGLGVLGPHPSPAVLLAEDTLSHVRAWAPAAELP